MELRPPIFLFLLLIHNLESRDIIGADIFFSF